jgi:hypothetical protein
MSCKGSWKDSARNIIYNGDIVQCELRSKNGNWISNQLRFFPQYEYSNNDGKFHYIENSKNDNISKEIFDKISSIAIRESKKKIINNLANEDDIIEITIIDSIPYLSKPTKNSGFIDRQTKTFEFIKSLSLHPKINIKINVGLHDSYSKNLGIMVYSLNKNIDKENILIPDYYSMCNYDGKLNRNDNIVLDKKANKAIFIGASTGSYNPNENERLQLCNKYVNSYNIKCYINNFCQIDNEKIKNVFPNYMLFKSNNMSIQEQLNYKYIINVDGNTCAWDRLPWILNSNSLCLKKTSNIQCWYYDFLVKNEHFVEFDNDEEVEEIINTITLDNCKRITSNANNFCHDYLRKVCHQTYMSELLYYITLNNCRF